MILSDTFKKNLIMLTTVNKELADLSDSGDPYSFIFMQFSAKQ